MCFRRRKVLRKDVTNVKKPTEHCHTPGGDFRPGPFGPPAGQEASSPLVRGTSGHQPQAEAEPAPANEKPKEDPKPKPKPPGPAQKKTGVAPPQGGGPVNLAP